MALQSDNLILRQETNAPNTTKGAELTFEELDNNFIFIYEDLKALQGSGALPAWVVSTTYSLNTVVSFDGFIWKYVNASPSAGVVPGSDPLFWVQMVPAELTHLQNSDTKLAEGTADEVTALEIRSFLDAAVSGVNIGNSDLTLTDSVRTLDLSTGKFVFANGKVILGTDLSLPYALSVEGLTQSLSGIFSVSSGLSAVVGSDDTGNGISGKTVNGVAVLATATANGTALKSVRTAGLSHHSIGKVLIEPTDTGSNSDSSILEVNSSTLGSMPLPRMTTTQKNAIVSPATGLFVFDTTTNRPEYFNGSFFQGLATRFLQVFFSQWNPTSGQTVAFGSVASTPQLASLTPAPFEVVMRGNGVVRGCDFTTFTAGVAGTNQAWSLYVRHNGTDYLVQTVSVSATVRTFSNTSLNIPYVAGDIVRMILINPTWTTSPTQVSGGGFLTLQ